MKVTLTELVDVVSKSGSPKATKVFQIRARQGAYSPQTDFYKMLRDQIVKTHRGGGDRGELDLVLHRVSGESRLQSYPQVILSYKKWWGKRQLDWFTPPSAIYTSNGVSVSINPELGLGINGVPHVIKLYFKADQLKKTGADLITTLMESSLSSSVGPDTQFAVLDVRRSRLFLAKHPASPTLLAMVKAELAYVAEIWAGTEEAA